MELNDVDPATLDPGMGNGATGKGFGVRVERCRFLEEAGCAGICVNACKVPTQRFFSERMGLPLTMEPNYDDLSCQFSFGRTPAPETADAVFSAPCLQGCGVGGGRGGGGGGGGGGECHRVQPS